MTEFLKFLGDNLIRSAWILTTDVFDILRSKKKFVFCSVYLVQFFPIHSIWMTGILKKKNYIFYEKLAERRELEWVQNWNKRSWFALHTKHFKKEARSLEPKRIEMIKFMIFVLHGSFYLTFLLYTRTRDEKSRKTCRKYFWNMYQKNTSLVTYKLWRKKREREMKKSTQPWKTLRNNFHFVPPLFRRSSIYLHEYKV